ncbi:phosphoacetylglucosamine mutase-like [Pyrus ussuriensis x Pyrus communis]|uniref:phosphoacetylglucosamine mutase n=1 Tax=Pyrus ussuriensis x Pyrus communis TaxID=2448454 RepID=A0A5N5FTB6_9ROSA|nr:phosphoacetylglucosamine mutase-like [Pyrus ussuriensis x Pyrus communis]
MNEDQRSLLLSSSSRFPPPQGVKLSYGTAGFRAGASILQSTVYRVGILAAIRALKTQSVIGLMITASHNKVSDNGVKVADPSGGMLSQDWEPFADTLANAPDPQQLVHLIAEFVENEKITLDGAKSVEILLARDTRPSGESLVEAAKHAFWELTGFGVDVDDKLVVDGANGVGGEKLELLKTMLTGLVIEIRNSGKEGAGVPNEGLGADYVQKEKVVPCNFGSQDVRIRCASLDGDADRLVYFIVPSGSSNKIELVNGDKILSLFAKFIKEQLSILSKEIDVNGNNDYQCRLGIVQTAYANGASMDYLKQLGLESLKAAEYDIGIYFEANGHGTILFSEHYLRWLETRTTELSDAVGDALSEVLLVEAILKHMGWSIQRWNEFYQDLPSRQLKASFLGHLSILWTVMDRTAVVTENAETVAVTTPGIQEAIDAVKYLRGRCFIRPLGTEDVIRVYAEASTQKCSRQLGKLCSGTRIPVSWVWNLLVINFLFQTKTDRIIILMRIYVDLQIFCYSCCHYGGLNA